jgi:coproporphyrinogen III oxidase
MSFMENLQFICNSYQLSSLYTHKKKKCMHFFFMNYRLLDIGVVGGFSFLFLHFPTL